MGEGAHGAGELPHANDVPGTLQTADSPRELAVPSRRLDAKGDRLRMNPVGSADHHGVPMTPGQGRHRPAQNDQIPQ